MPSPHLQPCYPPPIRSAFLRPCYPICLSTLPVLPLRPFATRPCPCIRRHTWIGSAGYQPEVKHTSNKSLITQAIGPLGSIVSDACPDPAPHSPASPPSPGPPPAANYVSEKGKTCANSEHLITTQSDCLNAALMLNFQSFVGYNTQPTSLHPFGCSCIGTDNTACTILVINTNASATTQDAGAFAICHGSLAPPNAPPPPPPPSPPPLSPQTSSPLDPPFAAPSLPAPPTPPSPLLSPYEPYEIAYYNESQVTPPPSLPKINPNEGAQSFEFAHFACECSQTPSAPPPSPAPPASLYDCYGTDTPGVLVGHMLFQTSDFGRAVDYCIGNPVRIIANHSNTRMLSLRITVRHLTRQQRRNVCEFACVAGMRRDQHHRREL